ncbi:MAG: thiamine-phosphate kinase [candidate division Zixibacteria bacterium]|nr:thiamine-phosphate kinase [candidate division Zixibacteria bacterium]
MRPGEFEWIEQLARRFGSGDRGGGLIGIGDDAAIIPFGPSSADEALAISVDSQVEDIHFRRGWIAFRDLALRLVHVGFSDIAAMGAAPLHALVSVEVGPEIGEIDLAAFTDGMQIGLRELSAELIGGNVSGRAGGFSAHVTAIGRQKRQLMLRRNGAHPGDGIYVTGKLGAAAAAIRALTSVKDASLPIPPALIDAFRKPRAHIREGLILAESGWATAAIDISDGLVPDLGHVCKASGAGAALDLDHLPIADELRAWMPNDPDGAELLALTGGENYVLLFTAANNPARETDAARRFAEAGGQFWRIGTITAEKQLVGLRLGRTVSLPTQGFDHLRGSLR